MYKNVKIGTGTLIMAALAMIAFFVILFYIVGSIMKLLTWAAPVLLIIALIFDYNTVLNYGKWLVELVKRNFLMGIGAIILSIIAYPIVFTYLLARAYMTKKFKEMKTDFEEKQQGQYVDYEVIEEEKPLRIDIPPTRPEKRTQERGNSYDDMFE